jgi:RNA polymerase sigma-70 factor (ECF subfamily)
LGELNRATDAAPETTEVDPSVPGLVARTQQGDQRSFERLYRLHVGLVYGICLRLVADPVRAETLTQDVFVRVWEKIGMYAGRGAFGAWVRRLAVNAVIDDRRSEARERQWMEYEKEGSGRDPSGGSGALRVVAGGGPESADASIDLERAIAGLPHGARTAFVLHDVYGYRHREIAEMTGAAPGTIKAQLHRARRLLRGSLKGSRG